jgi:hypothetical protein
LTNHSKENKIKVSSNKKGVIGMPVKKAKKAVKKTTTKKAAKKKK